MFAAVLYCQGGAFHSASNMYKHAVEIYKEDNQPDEVGTLIAVTVNSVHNIWHFVQYLTDLLYWIRSIWQHIIAHYVSCSLNLSWILSPLLGTINCGDWDADVCSRVWDDDWMPGLVLPRTGTLPYKSENDDNCAVVIGAKLNRDGITLEWGGYRLSLRSYRGIRLRGLCRVRSHRQVRYLLAPLPFRYYTYSNAQNLLARFVLTCRYCVTQDGIVDVRFGYRPILHYFFLSNVLALVIMIIWVVVVGGFKKRSDGMWICQVDIRNHIIL